MRKRGESAKRLERILKEGRREGVADGRREKRARLGSGEQPRSPVNSRGRKEKEGEEEGRRREGRLGKKE